MAPPRKRALPKPLPEGFVLTDSEKKRWRLGRLIGQGGCGLIYLASRDEGRPVAADADFVIKVEYQENGPLFSELKFYQRAAKAESVQSWKRSRKLDFLGIPTYWGSGLAEHNDLRYRFMVMDRLGSDLQKVCERSGGRLKKATVLQLGRGLVDVLEYIHENEYVHADIKAANLMLGHRDPEQVYLADYGLSYRYCPDGVHKEYKENPKKGHNGTIEYTSLDAHRGVAPSRRGDLQILGFCLLHWLCGSLPWDKVLKNPTQVQEAKDRLMDNLPDSVQQLSASGVGTGEVAALLGYVRTLDYDDKPDYQRLRQMLASGDAGRLDFSGPRGPSEGSTTRRQDPPTREKRPGRVRGTASSLQRPGRVRGTASSLQRPGRVRGTASSLQRPGRVRGTARTTEEEEEEEDEDEEVKTKPKPVPARYTRPPPLTKPQTQRGDDGGSAAVRSLRPRPVVDYYEEEEEEEEEERPRPIPACYLRGPPMGPRDQPKQRTEPRRTSRRPDHLIETSERPEQDHHHQSPVILTDWDYRDQTQVDYRDRWDKRPLPPKQYVPQWWEEDWGSPQVQRLIHHRPGSRHPQPSHLSCEWEAAPTQTEGPRSWMVWVGVVFFLGVLLVSQGAFHLGVLGPQ